MFEQITQATSVKEVMVNQFEYHVNIRFHVSFGKIPDVSALSKQAAEGDNGA